MHIDCLKSQRTGPSHTLLFKAQRKKRQQLLEEVFCGPVNNSYTGFLLLSYCWNPSKAACQIRNLSVLLELFLICLRIPPASPNIHFEMYYLKNGIMIRFFFVFLKIDSIGICHLPDKCVCVYGIWLRFTCTFIPVPYSFPVSIHVQMYKHLCRVQTL